MRPTTLSEPTPETTAAPRRRLRRLAAVSLATVVAATGCIVTGIVTAPEALAADNGQWSVFPAQPNGRQDRVNYLLEVAPGGTYKDAVTLKNKTSKLLVLEAWAADAFNSNAGGFAPRDEGKPNTGVGNWIKLSTPKVIIPPKASSTIPFTMTVPRSATPGDHIGAIMAVAPFIRGQFPAGGTVISARYSVGARVYVRVAGPLTPQLSVKDVQLDVTKKAIVPFLQKGTGVIRYTVVNTGNTVLRPAQQLTVTGLFGRSLGDFPLQGIPEILPGGEFVVENPWDEVPALDLVHVRVDLQAEGVSAGGDQSQWVISWIFLLVVAGLILAYMGYRRWRDSRRDGEAPASTPAGTAPFPSMVSASMPTTPTSAGAEKPGRRRKG